MDKAAAVAIAASGQHCSTSSGKLAAVGLGLALACAFLQPCCVPAGKSSPILQNIALHAADSSAGLAVQGAVSMPAPLAYWENAQLPTLMRRFEGFH